MAGKLSNKRIEKRCQNRIGCVMFRYSALICSIYEFCLFVFF